jgi:hypothetical protein
MELVIGLMSEISVLKGIVYANAAITAYILIRLLWKH